MKIGLICSQGGHLTEILQILEAFKEHKIFFATYYSAREEDLRKLGPVHLTNNIGTNVIGMFKAFLWALGILMVERPDAIVSTGAEIAIPFFYWSKAFGIRTIYIESFCRVDNLSITGRLIYPIADQFWVQWPQLLKKCGRKARFNGAVI